MLRNINKFQFLWAQFEQIQITSPETHVFLSDTSTTTGKAAEAAETTAK